MNAVSRESHSARHVRHSRAALAGAVVATALAVCPHALGSERGTRVADSRDATITFRSLSLPVRAEHRYRMLGRVRPFLFWIGRDDIGGARVTWRETADGVGYELLIGSDPDRAPRRINRWGYIGEERRGSAARMFGVMKQSNEESITEAEAHIATEAQHPGYVFKAIEGSTNGRHAEARVLTVRSDRDLSFRDIEPLLTLVAATGHETRMRRIEMPAGAQPGFLTALADLIHRSVAESRQDSSRVPATLSTPYVYNGGVYDLTVRSSRFAQNIQSGGHQYRDVIDSRFDSTSRATGLATHFQMTYGTTGALAEIPIHAAYQPRWWLDVQLFLDDATHF